MARRSCNCSVTSWRRCCGRSSRRSRLLAFLFNWNSFIFPLILIQTPEMRTLPVGLALFSARMEVDWVHLMAASTITALPIFIMFLFFQRQLIAGLVHEGVKG
jgi:multiple sugar transport system permease protein